jgi:FKBP-type peptidyl-prolyl cis-trans isomerase SlyD
MTRKVIGFDYNLKDKDGKVLDSSEGGTPLLFLEGSGMLIPDLEKELLTMEVNDEKNVTIVAANAYGEIRDDMIITVKRTQFPEDTELNIGDQFRVNQDPQMPPFTVKEINGEDITIDGNHPLAGIDLYFEVKITEKREATEEEIAHGHAHGVGGHHHH